jgi:mono/diheme cytochrome c family protein
MHLKILQTFSLYVIFMLGLFFGVLSFEESVQAEKNAKEAAYYSDLEYEPQDKITIWSRKSANYTDNLNPQLLRVKEMDLHKIDLVRVTRVDAQYGRKETYLGIPLTKILAEYKPQSHDDAVILHFSNGMRIPLPLESLAQHQVFLALKICPKKEACSQSFPAIEKDDAYMVGADPRPIVFHGNKIVVDKLFHPNAPERKKMAFSPWNHIDSLIGLETINSEAYQKQFSFGAEAGQNVFQMRCQFCHSVRYVGAAFGWDFVTPLPIYEKRTSQSLLNHVKYQKTRAAEMGLMMPNQADISEGEVSALWLWMRKAAKINTLPSYKP